MTVQKRNRRSFRQWLVDNWLEILLVLVFLAALAWIFSTTRSLLPQVVALPTATPAPLPAQPPPTPVVEQPPAPQEEALPDTFHGPHAQDYVSSQVALGPRPAGSPANAATADFIVGELLRYGWSIEEQNFEQDGIALRNIVARFDPAALAGSEGDGAPASLLALATPFDTRPVAQREAEPARQQQPLLGANDGASGVAVLLELARSLNRDRLAMPVRLAFLDGQAQGQQRSWSDGPGMQTLLAALEGQPQAIVALNMVGGADQQLAYEGNSDPALRETLWRIAADLGYGQWFIPEVRHSVADAAALRAAGLPLVNIIDLDYPYQDTLEDTADKLSPDSLERVGRVLEVFLEEGNK